MTNEEKIMKFRQLLSNINVTDSYEVLEETVFPISSCE